MNEYHRCGRVVVSSRHVAVLIVHVNLECFAVLVMPVAARTLERLPATHPAAAAAAAAAAGGTCQ